MTTRRWRYCAAVLICSSAAVVSLFADDAQFAKGIDAYKRKNWELVVTSMRDAINLNPTEADRKVGGGLFGGGDLYVPYFYLGDAFFQQERCSEALTAWEESDRQGVARRLDKGKFAAIIQRGYTDCDRKGFLPPPRFADQMKVARAAYDRSFGEYQRYTSFAAERPNVKADARTAASAATLLDSAFKKLGAGQKSRRAQELEEARKESEAAEQAYVNARAALQRAAAEVGKFLDQLGRVEGDIQGVEDRAREADALIASSPVDVAVSDALALQRKRIADLIRSARDKAKTARNSQSDADLTDAARISKEAADTLTDLRTQIEKQIKTAVRNVLAVLQSTGGDAFARAEARAHAVETALRDRPAPPEAKEFATLQKRLEKAHQTFDEAIRVGDLVKARSAAAVPEQLTRMFEGIGKVLGVSGVAVVPEPLMRAAQAFFEGRYRQALEALSVEAAGGIEMPLRIHAHVIRAAALFALSEYAAGTDKALLTAVKREVDLCHALDAGFSPNPSAFSPRFISFFRGGAPRVP